MRRIALALLALVACGDGDSRPAEVYDASRARRVFEPPPGEVRAVPPHAIHSKGIGPYVLGAGLKQTLELLPRGPRVALMEIEGLLDYSLVKAEDETLLIGVRRPGGVTFVAALDEEVARTEGGVGVGATVTALRDSLGASVPMAREPRDPRILVFDKLPNTRFVVDDGRVVAVLVSGDGAVPDATDAGVEPAPQSAPGCTARDQLEPVRARIVEVAASNGDADDARVTYGCISGPSGAEALVAVGDRLVVVGGDPDKPRRLASESMPGLEFAVPIELEGDRPGVAAVTRVRADGEYRVAVEILRLEGGSLSRLARQEVYRLSANAAAWIGARLDDVEMLIELESGDDGVTVGGLYVQRGGDGVRTIAPLVPQTVTLRQRRPAPSPAQRDAAAARPSDKDARSRRVDAGAGAGDAGTRRPR